VAGSSGGDDETIDSRSEQLGRCFRVFDPEAIGERTSRLRVQVGDHYVVDDIEAL
jgi:hypothetical protein